MRTASIVASIAAGIFSTGCLDCFSMSCANPELIVCVVDAQTATPIDAAVVEVVDPGEGQALGEFAGRSHCRVLYRDEIESARIQMRADGYAETVFAVSIPRGTCGVAETQVRDVALQRIGSSAPAVVIEGGPAPACE